MKLRYENGAKKGQEISIPDRGLTIGRHNGCDLQIDEDGISRKHCFIKKVKDNLVIEDLGSTNGIKLNGNKIEGKQVIDTTDDIEVGPYRFKLVADNSQDVKVEEKSDEAEAGGIKSLLNTAVTALLFVVFLGLIFFLVYYLKTRPDIAG